MHADLGQVFAGIAAVPPLDIVDALSVLDIDTSGEEGMNTSRLLGAVQCLARRVDELEGRLRKAEQAAAIAGNTASCLANGLKPD